MKAALCVLFFVTSLAAHARCHGLYADSILKEAMSCPEGVEVSLGRIPNSQEAQSKVSQVCSSGCKDLFNTGNVPADCDMQYASALYGVDREIESYANANGCTYDKSKIVEAAGDALQFASCFYLSEQVLQPGTAACGNTPSCVGMGFCSEGDYSGEALTLLCEAENGRCPTFTRCALGETPSWLRSGGARGSARVNDENFSKVEEAQSR